VANISQFLKEKMSVDEFIQFLLGVQLEKTDNIFYELNETDIQKVELLVEEKFKTWEWNFGYSPKYSFKNEVEINGEKLKIELNARKGIIADCTISGHYFSKSEAEKISNQLLDKRHFFEDIHEILEKLKIQDSEVLSSNFF
jgi:lipoate-protein ligase A